MTILIFREGPGARSLIQCNTCGLEYEVLTCTCKKSKLHFCDLECRFGKAPKYSDPQYREEKRVERYDARLVKERLVDKECMRCKIIYKGAPGGFSKNRDPKKPEPGLCPACSQRIPYDEGESAGVVNVR